MWNKAYEKLFGGFEDITANAEDDENEIPPEAREGGDIRLETLPASKI